MTQIDLKKLKEPFPGREIEWRVQQCGKKNGKFWAMVLCYLQARAVQNRFDQVVGPENWQTKYRPIQVGSESGVECTISVKIAGEWIEKTNVAPMTDIEKLKGAYSDSFKRAAVEWGVGRYLYELEPKFAEIVDGPGPMIKSAFTKEKEKFFWKEPFVQTKLKPSDDDLDEDHPDNHNIFDDIGRINPKSKNGSGTHKDHTAPTYPIDDDGFSRGPTHPKDDPETPQKKDAVSVSNVAPISKSEALDFQKMTKVRGWPAKKVTSLMKQMLNKEKMSELKKAELDVLKKFVSDYGHEVIP
jgi:hypothetical protein